MVCLRYRTTQPEVLIAILSPLPFEGFQELEGMVEAYLPEDLWVKHRDQIQETVSAFGTLLGAQTVEEINWNAAWEASFQPVTIEQFCAIRASFHPPMPGYRHEIVIDPKMAFGTGHHETTELMIRAMQSIGFPGKTVLDLGCGTGILAILAAKLGAREVIGVDNDPEAVQNTIENAELNYVSMDVMEGELNAAGGREFDVILANINRNVLLSIMSGLAERLASEGVLLLSGYLREDAGQINASAIRAGLLLHKEMTKGEWVSGRFRSPIDDQP